MGNKFMYSKKQKQKKAKENKIVRVLFLRKLLRENKNQNGRRIFAKFGLGVTKYEICPNLKQRKEYSYISTICYNSSIKKTFSTATKKFQEQPLGIDITDGNYQWIEQIFEEKLLISGGRNYNVKRFTMHNSISTENYQLQYQRCFHRTSFNQKQSIYVISGCKYLDNNWRDVPECEKFSLRTKSFVSINPILTPVNIFGCDQNDAKVYVFGGYN